MINTKEIAITYNSFDDLVEREPHMQATLENYLRKHQDYEYVDTEVLYMKDGRYKLVMTVRSK